LLYYCTVLNSSVADLLVRIVPRADGLPDGFAVWGIWTG